ncbi:hypothetical protein K502DRAFT_367505 [Neoconidiobolus thromboides FSU 785]|nr:hypothetical protein K502DRAFT_367505 [Neoconidiobolus thromboides FSU 785]
MSTSHSHHQIQRIFIGPSIEYWYKTEAWSLRGNTDRKASVEDIVRSTASIRSTTSNLRNNSLLLPNLTSVISSPNLEDHNLSINAPLSLEIPSPGRSLPYDVNFSVSNIRASELPKHCRALVRIEYAKEWNGAPGTYHSQLLNATERKFLPLKEFGLILYHNRLELTNSIDNVDSEIIFDEFTKLSLYSITDYSLAITKEHIKEHITCAYILLFPTPEIAKSWYLSLHQIMNNVKQFQDNILVSVPELNTKVSILISSPDMKVWSIKEAVIEALKKDEDNMQTVEGWEREGMVGMCWKHNDKIEWISESKEINKTHMEYDLVLSPQYIEQTHELQLRSKSHNILNEEEPLPVEGYLIFRGFFEVNSNNELKKIDSGRLIKGQSYYISTFQNHITFVSNNKFSKKNKSNVLPLDSIPFTLFYPKDRPKFDNNEKHMINKNDLNSHSNLLLLKNMDGFVDMREIVSIEESCKNQGSNKDPLFDITLIGNYKLRFEAWTVESRNEWVKRFETLIIYWKQSSRKELETQIEINKVNENFNQEEYNNDDTINDNQNIIVNPILWKSCLNEYCFPILKSGTLYIKDRIHAPFRKVHAILTLDSLHFFEYSVTSFYNNNNDNNNNNNNLSNSNSNIDNRTNNNEQQEGEQSYSPFDLSRLPPPIKFLHLRETSNSYISLKNCFIYSGLAMDLVVDGDEVEPHLYPDRLLSQDSELDRTFTLWESHLAYLWPNKMEQRNQVELGIHFLYRNMHCGHSLIWPWHWFMPSYYGKQNKFTFQTRSKLEKEHWIYCINLAIEYLIINDKWHY